MHTEQPKDYEEDTISKLIKKHASENFWLGISVGVLSAALFAAALTVIVTGMDLLLR